MATLNLRVDDDIRVALETRARERSQSLSEYIRDLLREAVVDVRDDTATGKSGDEPAPTRLTFLERKTLSMLHRILARLIEEDDSGGPEGGADDQRQLAEVLEQGFTGEYWLEAAGFSTELTLRDCRRVNDFLEMFRICQYSIRRLGETGVTVPTELSRSLTFRGFDHNRPLEHHMSMYVKHLVEDERWSEIAPLLEKTGGNSHIPMLETYDRMLAEYRRLMDPRQRAAFDDFALTAEELATIAAARIHPDNRGRR